MAQVGVACSQAVAGTEQQWLRRRTRTDGARVGKCSDASASTKRYQNWPVRACDTETTITSFCGMRATP